MVGKYLIRRSEYHDSVTLMEIARELVNLRGVQDAAVLMGTEANKGLLRDVGMLQPELEAATPNDLLITVLAADEATAIKALDLASDHLTRRPAVSGSGAAMAPRSISRAVRANPGANLALISVAGQYAAAEAWEALRQGLHVLLFSDNVSLEDEVALKQYAVERDLLLMGPDCGTAILNGVALGFANVVPAGPVGIVAASGTGLQEASTLLAGLGVGISQGIGTGGRDLKEAVGGLAMLLGIRALQADPQTSVLLLISKPPADAVAQKVLAQAVATDKPAVVCFLGGDSALVSEAGAIPAATLQEAAYLAAAEVEGYQGPAADDVLAQEAADLAERAAGLRERLRPAQRFARGLFSGGTLAYETLLIWHGLLDDLYSNLDLAGVQRVSDPHRSSGNMVVDLGADEFTVGRPHPMIDNDLRLRRLQQEAADPAVAVIILDVVLGYGAHPDPAEELGPAIERARRQAAQDGRELLILCSVTGTDADPQNLGRQVGQLEEVGVVVVGCNAAAARLAALIVAGR